VQATQELPNVLWNLELSLLCSHEPSTSPYPEADRFVCLEMAWEGVCDTGDAG
jgi:hypothetical protein